MPIYSLFSAPVDFAIWMIAILYALSIHEFFHAAVATWLGDDTAKQEGRLSLNPLAHIDWMGLILLATVGFGWGKPVPFNPYNLKLKRFGPALVALGGPLSNIVSMVLFALLLRGIISFTSLGADNYLVIFLVNLVQVNLTLFLFNLIPIPPLDGSKILYSFLSFKHQSLILWLERNGTWLLLALIFFGSSLLSWVFSILYSGVIHYLVL